MLKLTSRAFRKCCSFWDLEVLNHSYRLPKSTQISNFFLHPKAVSKKKDTATILSFERRHWISVGPIGLVPRWFNGSAQNSLLWPCLFFWTPHNYRDAFTFSAMCWLWRVITGTKITVALINYTFSDSSGRKLRHGPMLEKFFFE